MGWRSVAVMAVVFLVAACGIGRGMSTVTACGTTLWSGPDAIVPVKLESPPAGKQMPAPARSQLPRLKPQNGGLPTVFVVSQDCDHGAIVRVTAPENYVTGTVAHAKNGGIAGFTLNVDPAVGTPTGPRRDVVVAVFTGGRETGYADLSG